jgi:hypothetical protein
MLAHDPSDFGSRELGAQSRAQFRGEPSIEGGDSSQQVLTHSLGASRRVPMSGDRFDDRTEFCRGLSHTFQRPEVHIPSRQSSMRLSVRYRSASSAAMQPEPADVTACR